MSKLKHAVYGLNSILNLNNNLQGTQDLIGIDTTYDLTVQAHACVIGHINVIPEVPLGTISPATSALGIRFCCVELRRREQVQAACLRVKASASYLFKSYKVNYGIISQPLYFMNSKSPSLIFPSLTNL